MIRINNLSVSFDDKTPLEQLAAKRLELPPQSIAGVVIVRKMPEGTREHR